MTSARFDGKHLHWIEELRQDVRYAVRTFNRSPVFVAVAVLTLALGVASTTSVFSVVNALLLEPLPYPGSERLVRLMMNMPAAQSPTGRPLRTNVGLSAPEIRELQSRTRTLEEVGTAGPALMGFVGYEDAGQLQGARVSVDVFPMLGVRPHLGRGFEARDEAPNARHVIVISHSAWRRYFNGDPRVLGRALTLANVLGPRRQTQHEIVGVMPPGFEFPYRHTQFWLPFRGPAAGTPASRGPLLARIGHGVSMEAAEAEIGEVVRQIRGDSPAISYDVVREHDELVAPVRPALVVLMVAVGLVLMISCVNAASMLLARGTGRQRELAIRAALGAGRGRLIRQLLTESLLLAIAGGMFGAALATVGVHLLRNLATTLSRIDLGTGTSFPRIDEIEIDAVVLLFTLGVSVLTGVLCGIAPAIQESRPTRNDVLREAAAAASAGGRASRVHGILVIAEVALAMTLLPAGGLLIHSFMKLSSVDPGYNAENVLTLQVSLPVDRYPDERLREFAEDFVTRLRGVAGVSAAAYANQLPMVQLKDSAGGLWKTPDPTRKPAPGGADARFVSRDYLDVMGIRVIAGRGFGENDRQGHPRVLLVNEALAQREFGLENPVGQFVFIGRDVTPWQIGGVVANVRQFGLDREPEPQFFADFRQWPPNAMPLFPVGAYYAVRTAGPPAAILSDVRRILSRIDDQARLFNAVPMSDLVATTIARPRMYATLLGIFAGLAAALACIGIFSVIAYSVSQRAREIGIRIALGAQRSAVMRLVVGQTAALVGAGILLGVAGAAALTTYLESMLFGLTPLDVTTFGTVVVLFALVAIAASYVPVRRALSVNPAVALRSE